MKNHKKSDKSIKKSIFIFNNIINHGVSPNKLNLCKITLSLQILLGLAQLTFLRIIPNHLIIFNNKDKFILFFDKGFLCL